MGTLYVVKTMGHYHFFKTGKLRDDFLKTLSDWEQKAAETYEMRFGKAV